MRTTPAHTLIALCLLITFFACAKQERTPTLVTGTVTYRERMALPADAEIHVMLQDVSRQDVAAILIANTTVVPEGRQVPIPFSITVEPGGIDTSHAYAVRAEIRTADEVTFRSTDHIPVITRGNPIEVQIIVRAASHTPEGAVSPAGGTRMVGMYSYMADAGLFTACGGDARIPISMEGDNAALERAYSAAKHEPGAPVLVTFLGRIESRAPMEGPTPVDHVIVDRFLRVWPEETCEKAGVETSLSNTYWKLVELNNDAVVAPEGQREPHMILNLDGKSVAGSGECNRFTGTYAASGDSLRFGPAAATRMACPEMRTEAAFFAALEKVSRYEILGESLVLLGGAGPIARFRAVYL